MAEAPTKVNLGPNRPVVTPITGRFMPDAANPGGSIATADSRVQPRSVGAIVQPEAPSVAMAGHVSDIVSAGPPPVERPDPRFIPTAAASDSPPAEHSDTVEGSGGQRFPSEKAKPGVVRRLADLLGLK